MDIQISEHFNYKKLLRFVLPSIFMMIVTSVYGVIDGLFISNFVGKTPFAAINLIMPFSMILGVVLTAAGVAVMRPVARNIITLEARNNSVDNSVCISYNFFKMFIFKLFKWIFGIASGALSVLLLVYLGIKDENWAVLTSDGEIVVDKTMGICLIAVWAVVGALYLLFEYLHKRSKKKNNNENNG